jgi:hypothetical protein
MGLFDDMCKIEQGIEIMGMELDRWTYNSCVALFGVGDDWATLYKIDSKEQNKGDATFLLKQAKTFYKDKRFGGTVALSESMAHLYKKLKIKEYK